MKLIKYISVLGIFIVSIISCNKVEQTVKPVITIDTTLYTDGNWADYPMPVFTSNTNTYNSSIIPYYYPTRQNTYINHHCNLYVMSVYEDAVHIN